MKLRSVNGLGEKHAVSEAVFEGMVVVVVAELGRLIDWRQGSRGLLCYWSRGHVAIVVSRWGRHFVRESKDQAWDCVLRMVSKKECENTSTADSILYQS